MPGILNTTSKFDSFEDFLGKVSKQALVGVDVGCGNSEFAENLITVYPKTFDTMIAFDPCIDEPLRELSSNGGPVTTVTNTTYQQFVRDGKNKNRFDIVFFNCPSQYVWPKCLRTCRKLLKFSGWVVCTFYWEQFLTPEFNAFFSKEDVDKFFSLIAKERARASYRVEWLSSDVGYPKSGYKRVPGILLLQPIPTR